MKKTIWLIFFGCVFIFGIHLAFDQLFAHSIKYYLSRKMGSKCSYDKVIKQEKGWSFYNLKVSKEKLFDFQSKKLDFFIDFDWKTFNFSYRVETKKPKLNLQKIVGLPSFSSSKNSTFNISKLELSIKDEADSFLIDLMQKSPEETNIKVFSKKNQEIANLEISYVKANVSYANFSFNNLRIDEYLKLLKPFTSCSSLDCKGVINGDLSIQKKDEIDHFFANLKLSNILFSLEKKNIILAASSANVELEYPACISLKNSIGKKGLERVSDIRSKILFSGLNIKSANCAKEFSLADLDGFVSYNPLIGPKWNMKGKSYVDGIAEEIALEGKGFLNSLQNSWIEGKVCFDKSKQVAFKITDLKSPIRDCYFKIDHFTEKQFKLFQEFSAKAFPELKNFKLSKVNASLECNVRSNFNDILEFDVVDFGLKDLKISLDQKIEGLSVQEFKFKGSFDSSFDKSLTGIGKITRGEVISSDQRCSIEKISGQLEFDKGTFINSLLHLSINKMDAEISLNEEIRKVALIAKVTGKVDSLIDFLPQKNLFEGFKSKSFEGEITFKKGEKSELYGTFQMLEKEEDHLQFSAVFQDQSLKKISHGWIKGKNITLNNLFFNQIKLGGKASFTASFEDKKIAFLVKGKNLRAESDHFIFLSDYIGSENSDTFESVKCLQGSFYLNNSSFNISVPIENSLVKLKKYELEFSDVKGSIEANNEFINLQLNNAKSRDINFCGDVLLHKSESNEFDVAISTDKIYGKIEDFISFLSHFNINTSNFENLSGSFESLENGFELQYRQSKIFWRLLATIDKAKYAVFDHLSLDQINGEIELDSKGSAKFKDILGKLRTNEEGDSYEVYVPLFSKEDKKVEFDFRISNELRDIIRFLGEASIENDRYKVKLDDSLSHIFSSKLAVDNLFIKNKEVSSLSISSLINLRNMSLALNFFKKIINIPSLDKIVLPDFIPMDGELSYKFDYQKNKESSLEISGNELNYDHFLVQSFDLKAKFKDNSIDVSELNINDIKSSFLCSILNDHLEFRDVKASLKDRFILKMGFDLHSTLQVNGYLNQVELDASILDWLAKKKLDLDGKLIGEGRFSIDLPTSCQRLQIESDLNLQTSNLLFHNFSFDCKNSVRAYFSYSDGWILDGLSFDVVNVDKNINCLSCKIGKLLYRPSEMKYIYEDAHLYFFEDLFNKVYWQSKFVSNQEFMKIGNKVLSNKEICAFGEFDAETSKLTCNVKEHQVDYHDTQYLFQNIQVNITPESLRINSKYISSLFEFPLDFKIYYDESVHGRIILKEKNESHPMRIEFDFKNGFQIHSIVGRFHGVSARVQRDENAGFIASVKCDFRKIKDYIFPMIAEFFDELNMGDGYEFRGKILTSNNDFQFKGTFTGKDIELGGVVYQTLMSDIQIDSKSVEITDLKVSDRSGIFKINKLDIFKEKGKWSFAIPEFKIIEFRPSLLQKIGKAKDEIKPLVFREIALMDISGELEDKKTYKGHGYLSFINSFKRDHSVFDVPADFFGRIFGLDLELLIPVKGMADLELKDGKIYFSNLENAFSEGNRSKFFLASKAFPHTLDLNGELDIHIQMKHYVLFTFTESFILSLEGNLSDPKFGLKKKKTLFSK